LVAKQHYHMQNLKRPFPGKQRIFLLACSA
jgi:hypothetical protein